MHLFFTKVKQLKVEINQKIFKMVKAKSIICDHFYLIRKRAGLKVQEYVTCKFGQKQFFLNPTRMLEHLFQKWKNCDAKVKKEIKIFIKEERK